MSVFRGGQCCVEKGLWIKATVFHPISKLFSVEWVTLRYLNIKYTLSSSIVRYSCREMLQNSIWNPILLYTLFVLHGFLCDLSAPVLEINFWIWSSAGPVEWKFTGPSAKLLITLIIFNFFWMYAVNLCLKVNTWNNYCNQINATIVDFND